jgi:septal ring factor EnvC (AmiA/AmiB activator)
MKRAVLFVLLALTCVSRAGIQSDAVGGQSSRARKLKDFIQKEKPDYEKREVVRQDALEELDRLNSDENRVRERISDLGQNQQELGMALDNLSNEYRKQSEFERVEKTRVFLMLKLVYKLKKDGLLRFIVRGSDLTELGARVRVVYRTLRAHALLTHHLQERAIRLAGSEQKLTQVKQQSAGLMVELQEQESLLEELLQQKQELLQRLNHQQNSYQAALREFGRISHQLNSLFDNLEPPHGIPSLPTPGSLPAPLDAGKLVRGFGRSIHEKFGTVTFHKGLEIEAAQSTPVKAVMGGTVEFEGWVKGLGNVLIIHHGGGLYSLNAYLFKALVVRGALVKQGDTVALVGDTGDNDKPSLYFELRENGRAINPLTYFSPSAMQALR